MINKPVNFFPYGRHFLDENDKKIVSKSLNSQSISNGDYVKKFEINVSKYCKSTYGLSCNSGTSALLLAFLSINLKKDDVVIIPSVNFIASTSMATFLKAKIYFADVSPLTGQMTPENLLACIKKNNLKNIKAVVSMYLGGAPNNVEEFFILKKKYKFFLIEDACHAFGADYFVKSKKYKVGSTKHSDICCFSFHPLKTITTGEGGFLTTNNKSLAKKINLMRSHGIIRYPNKHWRYLINDLGFNFRLSDINAALGISQLKKISLFLKKRNEVSNYYKKYINSKYSFLTFPNYSKKNNNSWHLFIVHLDFKKFKLTKNQLFSFLRKRKIFVQYHYIPQYYFKALENNSRKYQKLRGAEEFYKSAFSLPIYPYLKNKEIIYILETIKKFIYKK
tara:strand:+ start:4717 stop:5892 length:1176 start_codon:yes stop_codon:yes gene_type:complete